MGYLLIFTLHKAKWVANFHPRSRHGRHFLFPLFQSSSLRYAARFMGGKLAAHKVKNQHCDRAYYGEHPESLGEGKID